MNTPVFMPWSVCCLLLVGCTRPAGVERLEVEVADVWLGSIPSQKEPDLSLGYIPYEGEFVYHYGPHLVVDLVITNPAEHRILHYHGVDTGWRPRIVDQWGNELIARGFFADPGDWGGVGLVRLDPGESAADRLRFELPLEGAQLELLLKPENRDDDPLHFPLPEPDDRRAARSTTSGP